ncbi:MAG: hypothetical protein ACC612_07890 [Methanomethylovorans sp.]|uniref:hypothetical protein n=1 Tax=Methanomethylovorans sp. TaxID=2758717 RepID=UPI00353119D2
MTTDGDGVGVTLYDREGLIDAVILKHNRMLEKYNFEFEELDTRFSSYSQGIDDSKKKHEELLERIDVLKEKRQQLYHQAEMMLDKLTESGMQQKDVNTIRDNIAKAKLLSPVNEEKAIVDSIMSVLSIGETSESKLSIKSKIEEAVTSHEELRAASGLECGLIENQKLQEDELNKAKPRHSWLEKRIQSHKEALKYWDKLKGTDKEVITV